MSDDLQIPLPGPAMGGRTPVSTRYRPNPAGRGLNLRPMVLAAGGLGAALLLLGVGGWALVGRKPALVPVIEADSRPLRVKPENAGGMQIAGADEAVLGGGTSGADRMAPTAEVPAPQALRAQMQQPVAPAVPAVVAAAPPVAAAAPAAVAAPGATPGVSPLPDTPSRAAGAARPGVVATARPAPAVGTVAAQPAAGGGMMVQLAALDSEAAAQAEWSRLSKRLPDLLGAHRLVVQKAERGGQAVFRVRTGGFADTAEATGFCGKLHAKGANCTVATF